jgi:hypothetical protein
MSIGLAGLPWRHYRPSRRQPVRVLEFYARTIMFVTHPQRKPILKKL